MTWRTLLQKEGETIVAPWVGGRSLRSGSRRWVIEGSLPVEHGWIEFALEGRKAQVKALAEPELESLWHRQVGYLVGDRLVPSSVQAGQADGEVLRAAERVHLIEPGLDRFVRVSAGRLEKRGGGVVW
jgi:hypothetical protein